MLTATGAHPIHLINEKLMQRVLFSVCLVQVAKRIKNLVIFVVLALKIVETRRLVKRIISYHYNQEYNILIKL